MRGYVELKVWIMGMELAERVYALGGSMPKTEQYGMTNQMQRAAASVPANIAEGYQRGTRKELRPFHRDRARFTGRNRDLSPSGDAYWAPANQCDRTMSGGCRRTQPHADPSEAKAGWISSP